MQPLIITGATASGKSALALALAEQLGGVVLNADSMQVYQHAPIIACQPSAADCARVPHLLYGIIPPTQRHHVAAWLSSITPLIDAALNAGQWPIIAGGTGLYIEALRYGLAPMPAIDTATTARVSAIRHEGGSAALYAALQQADPLMAAQLKPGDSQRLERALAVQWATGQSLRIWQQQPHQGALQHPARYIHLAPPRAMLYQRINQRFLAMIEAGAVAEVATLCQMALPADAPILRAVGVTELAAVLDKRTTLPAACALAQQNSRRYAKRQTTWFQNRHQADITITAPVTSDNAASVAADIIKTCC